MTTKYEAQRSLHDCALNSELESEWLRIEHVAALKKMNEYYESITPQDELYERFQPMRRSVKKVLNSAVAYRESMEAMAALAQDIADDLQVELGGEQEQPRQ